MLFVFPPIFVADAKLIYGYYYVVPFNSLPLKGLFIKCKNKKLLRMRPFTDFMRMFFQRKMRPE